LPLRHTRPRHPQDTGTFVIGGTDEIQTIVDDQIVKIQAMNGSPFVKPFKDRSVDWEATLQNLQVRRRNQRYKSIHLLHF
jgi:hypothetical protein